LKYKSTKAISCLNPCTILYNRSTSELRVADLLLHLHQLNLHQLNRIDSGIADSAKEQFMSFCADVQSVNTDKFVQFTREVSLDKFCSDILAKNVNIQHLWAVVKLVLVLSHGNASVEGV